MNELVGRDELESALKQEDEASAAGLDGIPFGLWKKLAKLYNENQTL